MSISKKLLKHLEAGKVRYDVVDHRKVYTAYDLAATLKKKLDTIAKSVIIVVDRNHWIAVLPGNRRVDLSKLKKVLKAKQVTMAKESVQQTVMKIRRGGITPFGVLYGNMPVVVDRTLSKMKKILVSTGSFEQSLHLSAKALLDATQAKVADFSVRAPVIKKKRN
ncbi:YbaK/EbsC family protein [Candidatus Uhrbacteria bacterium]|nr:YbaK/EbsC family protein [Candidatus Uhrbacteria bacterium]